MTILTRNFFPYKYSHTQRTQYTLIVLWILAMIALPILKWILGEDIIPAAVTAVLILQFIAVFYILLEAWGLQQTSLIFMAVAALTWVIEFIGSSTGFPFGQYTYTNTLQPQMSHVPLLIPVAWFMMLPTAWAVAQHLTGHENPLIYFTVSAAALTSWDLFLDPQMVDWGFWVWHQSGIYFGVPLVNFAGWFATAFLVTFIIRPHRWQLPVFPLLLVYSVVWFLQSIGLALFWNHPGPAFIGSSVMGFFVFANLYIYLKAISHDPG